MTTTTHGDGLVAPGFEEVRAELGRDFTERGEIAPPSRRTGAARRWSICGAAAARPRATRRGTKTRWSFVMSTTKDLAAMTLAVANARGWLDYDAPVASHWPEFAQSGKAAITVRQLLGHETGLVLLDEKLTLEKLRDLDGMTRLLARQKPARRRDKVCGARMPQRGDPVPLRQLVSPTNTLTPRHLSVWYIGCT
jgi:CubicO group peptidase (beta-lactamase class C family)